MVAIRIPAFGGMIPRLGKRLLPNGSAGEAVNCKLLSKELRPWNALLTVNTPSKPGVIKSIYLFGTSTQFWLHWNEDVDVVRGPIPNDATERTFFTGTDAPRVTDNSLVNAIAGTDYPTDSYLLGLPVPATAAVAALGAGGSGTPRDIAYIYTYVSGWGEEGPPAAASNIVSALPGQTVNLSSLAAAPVGDYNVVTKRIYRVNTGSTSAEYQFVAEIAVATTTYADSIADAALGEVIPSLAWVGPPTDMKGIITLPNGVLCGFRSNQVCFSEPYQPHAWPVAYRKAVDFPVVAIGAFGTNVVVATNANPYVIYGSDPSAMQLSKIPEVHSCISKRGLVSMRSGVIFPTPNGLVLVNSPASATLITEPIMTRDEWQSYNPATLMATIYDGRYFAWYENGLVNGVMTGGGFVIDFAESGAEFTELGFIARAAHADPETGKLYVLVDTSGTNLIQQWEGSTQKLDFDWRSKMFPLPMPMNLSAARVIADFSGNLTPDQLAAQQTACASENATTASANQSIIDASNVVGDLGSDEIGALAIADDNLSYLANCDTPQKSIVFKYYADGVEKLTKTVSSNAAFKLPSGFLSREVEVRLVGQVNVRDVVVATSEQDIVNG